MNEVKEVEDLRASGDTLIPPKVIIRTPRIRSIDVFRGLCIILMIFTNYGGGQILFFKHAIWNGIGIADFVFPWLLWLMGLSLTISVQRRLRCAVPRSRMVVQIISRSSILIYLGLILNYRDMESLADLRFPGILQRHGLTYLVVGLLEVIFTKQLEIDSISCMHDVLTAWPQWLFVICIVTIHSCVTFLLNVPGCGRGYLGPGGLDDGGKYFNCTGGAAGYIDRVVLGDHVYKHMPFRKRYKTDQYLDPYGILGTLTAILAMYLGVQAGRTLNTFQNVKAKVLRWLVWGLIVGLLGGCLCSFSEDNGLIPININMWSLSYVLVTSGMAFVVQAFLYLVVDVFKKWDGTPVFYPGMNPIVLFIGHTVIRHTYPFTWKPNLVTNTTYLFMHLWATFLWVSIAICLYKNNIVLVI